MVDGDGDVVINGETLESRTPGSPVVAADAEPLDPATTDPDVFKNQPYELILAATVPILEERRSESFAQIANYFRDSNKSGLPSREAIENPTPENMAAQDIERDIAADVRTITEISITNRQLAENLARAVYLDPVTYRAFVDGFNAKKHYTRSAVVAVSPELTSGRVGNYVVDSPSLVMLVTDMDRTVAGDPNVSPLFNRIVSKHAYGEGHTHYAVAFQMQADNPNFVDYPERLGQ
ncbi:hypothetical protein [Mycolicibacterium sp. PDY-3]|uniref:hypothetical protein n=1 Tax=Mycolicibacterium sp. PDY-3 TaxID=3376069 RepID=UPI00378FDAFC